MHRSSGLAVTLALSKVAHRLRRTSDLFKVYDRIVANHRICGHDIEVVLVSILVLRSWIRAPLLIAIVRAKIGDHDDDGLAGGATGAAALAWGLAS